MRKILWSVLGALYLTSSALMAQTSDSTPEHCRAIADNEERLLCYDTAFGLPPEEMSPEEMPSEKSEELQATSTEWAFQARKDEFDDSDISMVLLKGFPPEDPTGEANMAIRFICDGDGSFYISVASTEYIGVGQKIPVRYRFDDDPAIQETWTAGTDGRSAWLPEGYRDFRAGLQDSSRLAFEVTTFNGGRVQTVFSEISAPSERRDFVMSGCRE